MTVEELEQLFEKLDDEYIKFDRVESKLSTRPDLHAFLTLDRLFPGENGRDMVAWAGHDEISLEVAVEDLARAATEDLIRDLIRCGVRLSDDSLMMFV